MRAKVDAERGVAPEYIRSAPDEADFAFASKILRKDADALLDKMCPGNVLDQNRNPSARRVFAEVTGIKLPRSQKGTADAVRAWRGRPTNTKPKPPGQTAETPTPTE